MRRALFLGLSVLALGGGACASSDELDNDDGTSSSSGGRRSSSSSGGEEDATVSSSSGGFGGSSSSGGSSSGESSSSGGSSSGDADDAAVGEDAGDQDAGAADAASDASADASVDAGEDAAVDAGPDAEVDAGEPEECVITVRINELQVGPGNSDFVEIYNASACEVDLTGVRLVYRSNNGTNDVAVFNFAANTKLAQGGFFVVAHTTYNGANVDARFAGGAALAVGGGGLQLRSSTGAVWDSMGYGTATNTFVRGTRAVAPADGKSIGRKPDGVTQGETPNNVADFVVLDAPTPGATNGN